MAENLADLAIRPSYEQLRDSATGDAKAAWDAADSQVSRLRAFYEQLKEDPRYNEEYKAAEAWKRFEAVKDKVAANKRKAKEELQKQARTGERFSFPMPGQEPLVTNDTQKILAAQNEASRIVRRIDRLDTNAKGPFKPDWAEVLREEYKKGLEMGGTQGGIICRGTLAAAEEIGVDTHSLVDPFRKERHRESLERAQHAGRLTDLISSGGAPEPPFPKPGQRGRGSEPRRRNNTFLVDREQQPPIIHGTRKNRRPSWR
jgi:hypothetical protein